MYSPSNSANDSLQQQAQQPSTTHLDDNAMEEDNTPSPPVIAKKKSVKFAESMRVRIVLSLSDMTDDEIKARWYSEDESRKFELDVVRNVKAMQLALACSSSPFSSDNEAEGLCFRGLEHMSSSDVLNSRKKIKAKVVKAVMSEQRRQHFIEAGAPLPLGGVHDDHIPLEAMRRASMRFSISSKDIALRAGRDDAVFVRSNMVAAAKKTAPHLYSPPRHLLKNDKDALYEILGRALEASRGPSPPPGHHPAARPRRQMRLLSSQMLKRELEKLREEAMQRARGGNLSHADGPSPSSGKVV